MPYFLPSSVNLVQGVWSAPSQVGDIPDMRMGHRSVYVDELNFVYVHGGYAITSGSSERLADLLAYDPVSRVWRRLTSSPMSLAFHSLAVLEGVLVAFGGTSADCFQDEVIVYSMCECIGMCVCVGVF